MAKRRPRQSAYLAKAEPDEPVFVLLGRDRASAVSIKLWSHLWLAEIGMGLRPESDRAQVSEALKLATEMEIWNREYHQKREHNGQTFDRDGYPIEGPHRKLEKNSTSGANDGDANPTDRHP